MSARECITCVGMRATGALLSPDRTHNKQVLITALAVLIRGFDWATFLSERFHLQRYRQQMPNLPARISRRTANAAASPRASSPSPPPTSTSAPAHVAVKRSPEEQDGLLRPTLCPRIPPSAGGIEPIEQSHNNKSKISNYTISTKETNEKRCRVGCMQTNGVTGVATICGKRADGKIGRKRAGGNNDCRVGNKGRNVPRQKEPFFKARIGSCSVLREREATHGASCIKTMHRHMQEQYFLQWRRGGARH